MSDLQANERLIVNQLFDQGIFGSRVTPQKSKATIDAINALKRPQFQIHLNKFFKDLLGMVPENYQETLLFLFGARRMDAETVHVLLATIKAVINLPELQNTQSDRVVLAQTIIRQVHSEVTALDEKEIRRQITDLFVERFGLFIPDMPELSPTEQSQEGDDYWDVSPDFNYFAQSLINYLQREHDSQALTPIQRVNRALLNKRYLSSSSPLWPDLLTHKAEIASQWDQLGRFVLDCGDGYAMLLDTRRKPSRAKPFVVAISVAKSLGVGLPITQLMGRIQLITRQIYPDHTISPSLVKEALLENDLVIMRDGYASPTPIAKRFAMRTDDEITENEGELTE